MLSKKVLPPPADLHDAQDTYETVGPPEEDVDLNRDLSPPEGLDGVTVRSYKRKDGSTVQEYSVSGRVYMVRVQPGGGAPAYYLYDSDGDGKFERRLPGGYKPLSPPMWVIHRF